MWQWGGSFLLLESGKYPASAYHRMKACSQVGWLLTKLLHGRVNIDESGTQDAYKAFFESSHTYTDSLGSTEIFLNMGYR
jgi:hypothetical protein